MLKDKFFGSYPNELIKLSPFLISPLLRLLPIQGICSLSANSSALRIIGKKK